MGWSFVLIAIASFVFYLVLSVGSGTLIVWSAEELVAGTFFSLLTAFITLKVVKPVFTTKQFNPVRWIKFIFYCVGPLFFAMLHANFDVAYRVITGKINPGIVKISPELNTELGMTILANSITLTPGTLSVDTDGKNLYVHLINVKHKKPSCKDICGSLRDWVKGITE